MITRSEFVPPDVFGKSSTAVAVRTDTIVWPPPTLNPPATWTVSAGLPRTTVLLALTVAPAPIAVALVRLPLATLAEEPTRVLFSPVVLFVPASLPTNELFGPVELLKPAPLPT